jgi:hypothetical protein
MRACFVFGPIENSRRDRRSTAMPDANGTGLVEDTL